jgi:hypothetical protein
MQLYKEDIMNKLIVTAAMTAVCFAAAVCAAADEGAIDTAIKCSNNTTGNCHNAQSHRQQKESLMKKADDSNDNHDYDDSELRKNRHSQENNLSPKQLKAPLMIRADDVDYGSGSSNSDDNLARSHKPQE